LDKEIIRTTKAPLPLGPYSQGIRVGDFLFISAQAPIDPMKGKLAGLDIESQTRQILSNIKSILESAGLALSNVVKVTVFLKSAGDFKKMNDIYMEFFSENPPARTTVEASLPVPDVLVTIDAVACR
jgi:2-iminobutanoate/2-iminopropanoate deaminase